MANDVMAKVERVSHRYGKTLALDNITLEIPSGQMIGPDGAGKSTLLGLIAGVRIIQEGRVMVFGGNMADQACRNSQIGRIAYMPQGFGKDLYATVSVFENLDLRGRHMNELLKATSLDPFQNRAVGKLSGGMKQKLSLCCALIHDPDLLILNEPTTGVDPLSRRQFWELIGNIRARRPGMSVIVSTAYMDEAKQFAWTCAMYDGKVIAAGKTSDILQKTGEKTLEAAFIDLLPEEKRAEHKTVVVRPRTSDDSAPPVIEADGLTQRFGNFTAAHGTVEHLLVMPVVPPEIMWSNVIAKGSLLPAQSSYFSATLYTVSVATLGILLGTITSTMGQFPRSSYPPRHTDAIGWCHAYGRRACLPSVFDADYLPDTPFRRLL